MLTLTEAARVLGMNPGTLRVQIHNGKLRARKVGPVWTVTERELQRYASENRRQPPALTGEHP
jgi:excisionase family DNA binding protein